MTKGITAGIDIGTHFIKVVAFDDLKEQFGQFPTVLSAGISRSNGVRNGYIVNHDEAVLSVKKAIRQAEKGAGGKIKRAYIAIGGIGLEEIHSTGEVIISRSDSKVADLDIEKAEKDALNKISKHLLNKRVINKVPLAYHLDDEVVLGNPIDLEGKKLEISIFFITCPEHHYNEFHSAVEDAGVRVEDSIAAPLASSLAILSKTQKTAGCVMTDIGAESSQVIVFENALPVSLKIIPFGSDNITKDIALGFQIPMDEAEDIKTGKMSPSQFPRKKVEEAIYARLAEIFEEIESHLVGIGKSRLLPAGIITIGGGSNIPKTDEVAKQALSIPSKVAPLSASSKSKFRDNSWATAYGLCIWGMSGDTSADDPFTDWFKSIKNWFKKVLKSLLP